jgi:GDP-L-fucose synthase
MMNGERKSQRIYVAGHTGMVGSAISRRLAKDGHIPLLPRARVDLRNQQATLDLFDELKPEFVYLAAARVGGILANSTRPAEFIYDNLMIQANVMHSANVTGVKKLLFLGSSCIYPKACPQPIKEDYLLSGYLEPTNQPYAVAKIAGLVMAQSYNRQYGANFVAVMPTNLYGPGDNFDLKNAHVIPALLRKIHEAKTLGREFVEIWGTGIPQREFLHVDDLADACVFLMQNYDSDQIVNIGTGEEISIRDLAGLIKEIVGYEGSLVYNNDMPDGTLRKLVDNSRLTALGWAPSTPLKDGLTSVYRWFLQHIEDLRK